MPSRRRREPAQYVTSLNIYFRPRLKAVASQILKSQMKTENLAFLESVTRQFSSLPIFVDCNKVRKHFEYIFCAWMEAFQVCKCKSTADRTCDFTPLSARVEVSNIISRSTLNEKLVFSRLIKVASLTIFCVALPSYNFMVSIKDDFYCGYFALRDERWPISGIVR